MKIVFFLADLYGGGAEKVSLTLINELSKKHEVTLILVRNKGVLLQEVASSVSIMVLNSKSVYKSFFKLYQQLKLIHPDIVMSSLDTANIVSTIVSRIIGIKNIVIVHGIASYKYKNDGLMKFLIRSLRYSSLTIAVSNGVKQDLNNFGVSSKVIYNPIFTKVGNSKKEKIILAIGRLEKVKNYPLLIDAFKMAKLDGYKLYILGEGSLKRELELYIEKKKVDNVYLLGFVKPYEFYKKATLLVNSSMSESFGNVIVEALSFGVDVVATETVGAKEILQDGKFGSLVEINDAFTLAKTIKYRVENPLQNEILQERAQDFNIDKVIDIYEKTILEFSNVDSY